MNRQKLRSRARASSNSSFTARRWEKKSKKKIYLTLTVIAILLYSFFTWFLPTLIGSLSFVNQFKPAPTPVPQVADSVTLAPPVLNIPFEATGSSTIKVKGYASPNTSVKIYLDDDLKSTVKTSGDGSFTSDDITLSLGSNNIYGKTVDESNHESLPSTTLRISYINEKPDLSVDSPADNQVINGGDKKVTVSGKVNPKENMSLTINGQVIILKDDGSFSQSIDINEGDNNIVIKAIDQVGNSAQVTRKVTYNP